MFVRHFFYTFFTLILFTFHWLSAAEEPTAEQCFPIFARKNFEIKAESKKDFIEEHLGTKSPKSALATRRGLQHLFANWEVEAARYFAQAMREDPNNLFAHWGMAIATFGQSLETEEIYRKTLLRITILLEQDIGSELEQGLAYALIKQNSEGFRAGATLYRKVAARFPESISAQLISSILNRGGYDSSGTANPAQETEEAKLITLIKKNPACHTTLHAYLTLRGEARELSVQVKQARQLTRLAPGYAPYFYLLGHYEWRTGQHKRAAVAFGRASKLYAGWMTKTGLKAEDCPEWTLSEAYRVVALTSNGEMGNARAIAKRLGATKISTTRPNATGTKALLYFGKSALSSIALREGTIDRLRAARALLPQTKNFGKFRERTLAHWWLDGLRLILEARENLASGDIKQAKEFAAALNFLGKQLTTQQNKAIGLNEFAHWRQAKSELEVLALELQGLIATESSGDRRKSAFNWFKGAADRHTRTDALNPPRVLQPMSLRVGDYLKSIGRLTEANEAYQKALQQFPKDAEALKKTNQ